jgi:hypothetical protein
MNVQTVFIIVALVCFILAACNVPAPVNFVGLGLSFYMGALLLR